MSYSNTSTASVLHEVISLKVGGGGIGVGKGRDIIRPV